ncbi:hypothetical protein OG864_51610 [Streptomyces sp. NBC_00124]|nr:hypothetical protein [Streptomyces sp. NBC_00124]MCX5367130.1 hypothetical protein [Streptomyces sp. NBC_00124]
MRTASSSSATTRGPAQRLLGVGNLACTVLVVGPATVAGPRHTVATPL